MLKGATKGGSLHVITLGANIEIELNGAQRRIVIKRWESDPTHGIISSEAPLGKVLLGAKEGDIKEFTVKKQENTVRVVAIDP